MPKYELEAELLLLLMDAGGIKMKIILNERFKRALVAGVTIITYLYI